MHNRIGFNRPTEIGITAIYLLFSLYGTFLRRSELGINYDTAIFVGILTMNYLSSIGLWYQAREIWHNPEQQGKSVPTT